MQTDFWLECWRQGRTGFHRARPMPLLRQYWPTLALSAASHVLVPLCGKTPDLIWLAAQGHRVLGVELSPLAIEQFFDENGLAPERHESTSGVRYRAGNIEIIQGDVFDLDDATLTSCDAAYDRAAIVALPAPMRERYARRVHHRLANRCQILMLTLEYPQHEMDGPPFSVPATEIDTLYGSTWNVRQLERRDILESEPGFRSRGVTSFHTSAFRLSR